MRAKCVHQYEISTLILTSGQTADSLFFQSSACFTTLLEKSHIFILYKQTEWQVLDLELMIRDRWINEMNYERISL